MKAGKEKKTMVKSINGLTKKMINEQMRKLEEGKKINGASGTLENEYEEFLECGNLNELEKKYQFIQGFLYGLYGAYYITEEEHDIIRKKLSWKYREKCREILDFALKQLTKNRQ